ncbi:MAG: PorT family protein [Flavobacteriales bacterium]|nr:PorT family protein [Flavobacteriales bacterium]
MKILKPHPMKKVVLGSLALGLSVLTYGQVDIGAKAGLNYNIWTLKDADPSNGIGFHLGAYGRIPFSDMLAFQPELLFTTRGVKESIDETVSYTNAFMQMVMERTEGDATVKVSYIEVPLLLDIMASEGFHVHVGPVLALRMGYNSSLDYTETQTVAGTTTTSTFSGESSDDTGIAGFDFAAAAGLNYEMESGFNLGLRYLRGFTSIAENSADPLIYNGIQFSLGFTFIKN